MDDALQKKFAKLLSADDAGRPTPRLLGDARRLSARLTTFRPLVPALTDADADALQTASFAVQLPLRHAGQPAAGRFGQTHLRERLTQAAELLVTQLDGAMPSDQIEATAALLGEAAAKPARLAPRLLADVMNLDDFGVVGLLLTSNAAALRGEGVDTLVDGMAKREAYGYWAARLRDGFHFEPIRVLAEKRLTAARKVLATINAELADDSTSLYASQVRA